MERHPLVFSKPLLEEWGYTDVVKKNDRWIGLNRMLFTVALVYGFDEVGYTHRFCYSDYRKAKAALDAWDGVGEPDGWHRALVAGKEDRRIGKDGQLLFEDSAGRCRDVGGRIVVSY